MNSESLSTKPSSLRIWISAIRPATLGAAFIPVAVGGSLAWSHEHHQLLPLLVAFTGAVLIQIATNLHNDYEDFVRGADTEERLGEVRVTQKGWLSSREILTGALVACLGMVICTVYLTMIAGWPVVLICVFSILSGFAYTGGPMPLGYHGLGDVFVFLFFGLVAVGGTYYVMALELPPTALLAATPVGLLTTAILVVNNLRDRHTDVKVNKRTLVVRFGEKFGRYQYHFCILGAYIVPIAAYLTGNATAGWFVPFLSLPLGLFLMNKMRSLDGKSLNPYLGKTAMLGILYAILFAVGVLV